MKKIAEIVESIHDEICGAEGYAKLATKYKADDKVLADAYIAMATQELEHVDKLHAQVVRLINVQKVAGKEVPAGMQMVWDWEHDKIVDNVSRVRSMMDMYKK